MKRVALILVVLSLLSLGAVMVQASQEKMDLRYHWLWGWQFHKDGKWHNVGLFASELRRAVRDVEEAAEAIDQINIISLGARLASTAGGVITATNVNCTVSPDGEFECTYGPLYLLGAILSGVSHVSNQIIQGIYFDKAIRIYNKAQE